MLTFVDVAGITRVKVVPVPRLPDAAARGVGMSPVFDTYQVDDSATPGRFIGGPDGDLRLVPDLSRLRTAAPVAGWASAPVDRFAQDGTPHPACQRAFARRQAARAADDHGLELRMGFETEWISTLPGDDDAELAYPCEGPAYGAARIAQLPGYLTDLLRALDEQEVTVLQLHPEYSPGQFELSTAPEDPVGAADTAVLVREAIRAVGLAHGQRSCFGPVLVPDGVGNGRHLHLSLWRDGRNLCRGGNGPFGMTEEAEFFLAGVLRELPALLAIGAPSPASYLRLIPSHWAGVYQVWGHEAREAALRFVTGAPDDTDAANAEVKCLDPAANPYLVVGAVIAAGLAGIDDRLKLPEPISGDPAAADGTAGGPVRLPTTLREATDRFTDSEVLKAALGEVLHDVIRTERLAEVELFAGRDPQEIAAATRWRY
ncbi:glutamine synthetase family protein [Mangrovactinospora gilvigrisea]|nr:glutamine synthetase family protein [Mangrovactinospora gilvigrisea]